MECVCVCVCVCIDGLSLRSHLRESGTNKWQGSIVPGSTWSNWLVGHELWGFCHLLVLSPQLVCSGERWEDSGRRIRGSLPWNPEQSWLQGPLWTLSGSQGRLSALASFSPSSNPTASWEEREKERTHWHLRIESQDLHFPFILLITAW